jgi:L-lysine 6-transaminase
MDKSSLKKTITGTPEKHIAGLQNDWWTEISPDLWNSHGSYLRDSSGTEYLDMCCFFSSSPIRYDHPRMRDPSFMEKIAKVAICRTSLGDFWIEEMADFIDIFREIATPAYMHHFFFIDGGSLAVENAMKAAFDWKVRLNIKNGKIKNDPQEENQPLGTKIIYFENSFHGRSGYTLSMTHTSDPRKYKYFPKFDWFKAEAPVYHFNNDGRIINQTEVQQQQKESLDSIQTHLQNHGDDIAAIVIEPIQCEGGDRHIPIPFFAGLRQLADRFNVLLIFDEVQTGFGATGKMWGHEHFGKDALPDLIAFSKKSQVGGIMANYDKFSIIKENVFGNDPACKSRLNSTWGGNPVDMVRAARFLTIIQEENLLENAQKVGAILLNGIQDLCRRFSNFITNPRGRGLIIGFDAVSEKYDKLALWSAFKDEKLLCLVCGQKTVRLRPHLDLTQEEARDVLQRMTRALQKI